MLTNFIFKTLLTLPFLLLPLIAQTLHSQSSENRFVSPYSSLNWSETGHFDAMFHVHPGLGAEQYDPHETIDRYHAEGFQILAFSPHDYDIPDEFINNAYPWTKLSEVYKTIKDVENPTEEDQTYAEFANSPYENRDPVELGMVSIQGSEISANHHIVSLFNDLTKTPPSELETFDEIEERGGIAYFAHPGRYIDRWGVTAYWYVDLYLRTNQGVLIGQSIYNRIDNHPGDRAFYDKIVHVLGADRPVWLIGEDDMHHEGTLAWNRNVILLEDFEPGSLYPDIQDGSAPDVKQALIDGRFYVWKPTEQYNKRSFNLIDVTFESNSVQLFVDHTDLIEEIRWITHDPSLDESLIIHYGQSITIDEIPEYYRFVRAELQGEQGTIYTQPFYLQ